MFASLIEFALVSFFLPAKLFFFLVGNFVEKAFLISSNVLAFDGLHFVSSGRGFTGRHFFFKGSPIPSSNFNFFFLH